MDLEIRAQRPEDADAKGYVHWKSWQETYIGLMPEEMVTGRTLESRQELARKYPENTFVALLDGKVIGFSCYHPYWGSDLSNCGEVQAIYVLQEAQGLGIGRKMMDAAIKALSGYNTVALWVLKGNEKAIGFYEHYGFRFDGGEKTAPVGTELRMILHRA